MTLRILNIEPGDYSSEARAILESCGSVTFAPLSRGELKTQIGNYDILVVRLGHTIDREILEAAKKLRVIVTATTGLNHIDLQEAEKRNITVLSLRGETTFLNGVTATAEHTVALMLALQRHIPAATADVRAGQWHRDQFKGYDLAGKTLGIIGLGRLGRLVAGYAKAFGMKILAHDIRPVSVTETLATITSLENVLGQADIVSLHASYTPENENMIGSEQFNIMKKKSSFINTARGELVDESALLEALKGGKIAGAALDVLAGEQSTDPAWVTKHPLIAYAKTHQNLVITPHIGGATYDSMEKTEIFMARKLEDWLKTRARA